MQEEQRKVSEFIKEHGLDASPEFRVLDLVAEVGEIASDAAKSSGYGDSDIEVEPDEIGDAMFSLLAVAEELGIDASEALERSLEKYRGRIEQKGDPGSR